MTLTGSRAVMVGSVMARMPADQLPLRFPQGLRDQIKKAAATNRRSMNAEIVIALEKIFGAVESTPPNQK
ncbi:Arc family DNA-binding protein [Xanthobacter sp. V0B-10]|uniref:Arc family DNA-binding protein n=1 Tax=Xanthobacter albus TaxID=3119929 RepID=UPI003726C44C